MKARNSGADSPAYRARSSFKLISLLEKYPQLLATSKAGPALAGFGLSGSTQDEAAGAQATAENSRARIDAKRKVVVDLGAAPGGWSQVIRSKLNRKSSVFALDIDEIEPIEDVDILQGDFLDTAVQRRLAGAVRAQDAGGVIGNDEALVDVVLSDMMGSMSGNKLADLRTNMDLVEAASTFAFANLKSVPVDEQSPRIVHIAGREEYPGGHLM